MRNGHEDVLKSRLVALVAGGGHVRQVVDDHVHAVFVGQCPVNRAVQTVLHGDGSSFAAIKAKTGPYALKDLISYTFN